MRFEYLLDQQFFFEGMPGLPDCYGRVHTMLDSFLRQHAFADHELKVLRTRILAPPQVSVPKVVRQYKFVGCDDLVSHTRYDGFLWPLRRGAGREKERDEDEFAHQRLGQ